MNRSWGSGKCSAEIRDAIARKREKGTLLPIQSVRYGPTLKQKQAVNALSLLFQQKGYPEIPFNGADIPVVL